MTLSKSILSENELIELLRKRDPAGLNYLYDHYASALYGTAIRIVGKQEFAEEVLQDAFLNIWDRINQFDQKKGKLFTWMINIVRNKSIDKLRSSESKKSDKSDDIDHVVDIVERKNKYEQNFDALGLKDHLINLNEEVRFIVKLIYFEGYTHSEIAKEFDIPLGTVKTRLRSGLKELRKIVGVN